MENPKTIKELKEVNEILRSVYQVCLRKGIGTNWDALTKNVGRILDKQFNKLHKQ